MKLDSSLTKALFKIASQTLTNNAEPVAESTPQLGKKGTVPDPEPNSADNAAARDEDASKATSQDAFSQMFKGIATQVAAAVTEGLARQVDQKVDETVQKAELAVERQRTVTLKEMQTILQMEREKAMDGMQRTVTALSNKILGSAAFIGGSLLMVATALFLHK